MTDPSLDIAQIHHVNSFDVLASTPFQGHLNALCWERNIQGDFSEIVRKVEVLEHIVTLHEEELRTLKLSQEGELARNLLLQDLKALEAHGASPTLNVIKHYERDDSFFPTDVYSYHVDRSPLPTDTYLCTYYGMPSELLPNAQAQQKVLIPEIRQELKKRYPGNDQGFEAFLKEYFFDLHYEAKPNARPQSLGVGNLWKLAVDHPQSKSLPCVHRAPKENPGECRLLMIC